MAETIVPITYFSTNNRNERVNFETALLKGIGSNYGLYMIDRNDIPKLSSKKINGMQDQTYPEVAYTVLNPFLKAEIPKKELKNLLEDAYNEKVIPTAIQHITGETYILWLTKGPTYSFKDYAARFFGRTLNYFLEKRGLSRTVLVATSGDTGGAVADALYGLANVDNVVFYPKEAVSEGQRRQMTTLGGNIYAVEVNGDFDVCQDLVKNLLGDKSFHTNVFNDVERLTSANSISIGRLLPQVVYPFYAYSRVANGSQQIIASIPSGNFGDMMGTVIAREMGLPVSKIVCGVNENMEFPRFLNTGQYRVEQAVRSPSSAMDVSHPSNLARLFSLYGGHMYDRRDEHGEVMSQGIITKSPNIDEMRKDIFSIGIENWEHYRTMEEVYQKYGVLLDPHGAVGWRALEKFLEGKHDRLAVIYETADPGKFPDHVKIGCPVKPNLPEGMKTQKELEERIYYIESEPEKTDKGLKLSTAQIQEAKALCYKFFGHLKTISV